MESFGMTVSDEAYEGMRREMAFTPYTTAGAVLVFAPMNVLLGGTASFRQLFAVMAHASVISALQQLFTAPIDYFRGAGASAANLAALLPMADPTRSPAACSP